MKKNRLIKPFAYLLLFTILFFSSCRKDDAELPPCGCNSETLLTIPDRELNLPIEEQKVGLLFYKHPETINRFYNEEESNNRFWIFHGTEGCYNCQRNYIICNEDLLGSEYDFLKQENVYDSIQIKFSGALKLMCGSIFAAPADYDYKNIILTQIEKN